MSINPDFTKVALPDHPSCSYDEWKKNLEEKMGENYDAFMILPWNVFLKLRCTPRISMINVTIWTS